MSKLTKAQAKAHARAVAVLEKHELTDDEREFVIENWQESAQHINSAAGAFFTPLELARSFATEVGGGRIIDLCAGIGCLSYAVSQHLARVGHEITCVEINPAYVEVGRKIVPQATWIVADALAANDLGLGRFDVAISNPPYGAVKRERSAPRYRGREFEYHLIDVASDIAGYGVFIVPHMSAGFRYSGAPAGGWPNTIRDGAGSDYFREPDSRARDFERRTGFLIEPSCGIDTSFADRLWRGVAPRTEIVTVDFDAAQRERAPAQSDLFGAAA